MHLTSGRNKGFTLIEVLVALALAAILAAALYGTFFSVLGASRSTEEGLDRYIEAGRFLDRFSEDVHSADFSVNNSLTMFAGETRGLNPIVAFTAFTHPVVKEGASASDLIGVSYYAGDNDGRLTLIREVWNPYTGDKVKAGMVDGIAGFEVSYYNGRDWSKAWDSSLEKALPLAVKATVTLSTGEELSMLAQTKIR